MIFDYGSWEKNLLPKKPKASFVSTKVFPVGRSSLRPQAAAASLWLSGQPGYMTLLSKYLLNTTAPVFFHWPSEA